jgi:hypothetical protein
VKEEAENQLIPCDGLSRYYKGKGELDRVVKGECIDSCNSNQ